ncbi:MAG: hypothetical protein K8T10_09540 [Candidatus Eremiobacteraeota bacterium]|nr:hypothetical protein [Candidatus Eremiobacteraeota bacterium]
MHRNLTKVQENIIGFARETLDTFEINNKKPVVLCALSVAEKPLTKDELAKRTGLNEDDFNKAMEKLLEKEIVVESSGGSGTYELNHDVEKVMIRRIRSHMESVMDNMQEKCDESRKLLDSGRQEFDNYDILMEKFLRCRIKKGEMIHRLIRKKMVLFNFLETGEVEKEEIKKISIE